MNNFIYKHQTDIISNFVCILYYMKISLYITIDRWTRLNSNHISLDISNMIDE